MAAHEVETMMVKMQGDASSYQKMTKDAEKATREMSDGIAFASKRISFMGMSMKGYGVNALAMLTPLLGVTSLIGSAFKGVQLAAAAEQSEVAFGVMLKNQQLGKQMVADLQKFAAETPLGTADLEQATKSLLQFGIAGEQIIPTLRRLGDVGGGDADKLKRMAVVFGQVKAAGRLMGGDELQLVQMGFAPLKEMEKTLGKSSAELNKMQEQGKITFKMLEDAFISATSEGGSFKDQMILQSQTVTGLFSTMKDDIDASLRNFGKLLIEHLGLKELMKTVSELAQATTKWFQGLDSGTKTAVVSVIAATVAFGVLTVAILLAFKAVTLLTGGFNLILIGGVAALSAFFVGLGSIVATTGGLVGAIANIKQALSDAWEWTAPIRKALISLFTEMYRQISFVFTKLKEKALEAWEYIKGQTNTDWDEIRSTVIEAIYAVEFAIQNLPKVWETAWAGMKYYASYTLQWLLSNLFVGLFVVMLPGILLGFLVDWKSVFKGIWEYTRYVMENAAKNMVQTVKNIMKAIKGEKVDVWWGELFDIDQVKLSGKGVNYKWLDDFVAGAKEEFEKSKNELGKSFQEFLQEKLSAREQGDWWFLGGETRLPYDDAPKKQKETNKELEKELHKTEGVLKGSAEALSRIADYRERMGIKGKEQNGGVGQAFDPDDGRWMGKAGQQFLVEFAEETEQMQKRVQEGMGKNFAMGVWEDFPEFARGDFDGGDALQNALFNQGMDLTNNNWEPIISSQKPDVDTELMSEIQNDSVQMEKQTYFLQEILEALKNKGGETLFPADLEVP